MKKHDELALKSALSSGQNKRLISYRNNLSIDRDKVLFDPQVAGLLRKYAKDSKKLEETISYLNNLVDADGYPFSQSLRQYEKLDAQIYKFAEPNYTSFRWNRNYQKALKRVLNIILKMPRVRQMNYGCDDDIIQAIPKSDTHSGFSFILTGKKQKGEYFDGIYERYVSEEKAARECGSFNKYILPGTRTQGSGAFDDVTGEFTHTCKHKTRLVSMIDIYQIIAELKFAKPFQQLIAHLDEYAGGKDDAAISNIIANCRRKNAYWYSLDYSSFDQSISNWLIQDAFAIIRQAFAGEFDDELFSIIQNDFIHKNFISAQGVIHSDKGVPSGSMFTQIIDSIVNLICVYTYLYSIGIEGTCIVMGDDNLLFTNTEIDGELIASYMRKNLGLTINADKIEKGKSGAQPPKFLSREWRNTGQWRHPNVLISKLLYPERFRPYSSGDAKPEDIIYGYYLTYKLGMSELLDMGQFFRDYPFNAKSFERVVTRYVPGALQFNLVYLRDKSDIKRIVYLAQNQINAAKGLKSAVK